MSFYDSFLELFRRKESEARVIASINAVGKPIVSKDNYESFAHKGFSKNAIVYTAIHKIATSAKQIEWVLYNKRGRNRSLWTEIEDHPLLSLLDRPNPMQSKSAFFESLVGFFMIAGNSYVEANRPSPRRPPTELWPVRPDKMRLVPGANGYPAAYEFTYAGQSTRWAVDPVSLKSDILHMKSFNPLDDWYGLSPISAFLLSLDQYNHASRWNLSLLQNEARPSGVLQMAVTKDNPRGSLSADQYAALKEQVSERSGAWNAGRPLILQGGLEWKQMSLTPKDMDFINAKNTTANDILIALGVPGEMVGLGKTTFNNYAEARLAFYEETIIPLMDSIRDEFNSWLVPMFGDSLCLEYDKDSIDALVEKRDQKYTSLQSVSFLTANEKREAVGYAPIPGLDVLNLGPGIYHIEEFADVEAFIGAGREEIPEEQINNTETINDDRPETEEENDENDADSDDDQNEVKSINLLGDFAKRKVWRQQNRARESLARPFEKDVVSDFSKLNSKLADSASKLNNSTDKKLLEYAFLKELDEWAEKDLTPTLKKHIKTTLETFGSFIFRDAKSLGVTIETKNRSWFDNFVLQYVERQTAEHISTIKRTSQKKIKRVVSEWVAETIAAGDTLPELTSYIKQEFNDDVSEPSARRIARTEVAVASNNGSLEAARALEIPNMRKEWIAATDDRTRDSHAEANGSKVELDQKFIVNGQQMDGPGDTSADPAEFINCRCVLVYSGGN